MKKYNGLKIVLATLIFSISYVMVGRSHILFYVTNLSVSIKLCYNKHTSNCHLPFFSPF